MAEARKTFPMSVFAACIKGENKDAQKRNVAEMLGFMTKKDIDAEFEPFAVAISKAYIYEQHPELVKMKAGDVAGLGDQVSVQELPAQAQAEVDTVFAKLTEYRKTVSEQGAKIAELEKALAEATAKLGVTEKSLAEYKAKADKLEAGAKSEGEKVIVASEEKVTGLNQAVLDLAGEIDKVKSSIISILKAAPSAGGAAAASGEKGAGAPETGGAPADTFGFGSDPFSDSKW